MFQMIAGGWAGFVEVSVMQPLDVVKTRLQLDNSAKLSPRQYKGLYDCCRKMWRREGGLSFWKGILPPILIETPKRAIKFLVFEQVKPIFLFGSPTPTLLTFSLAGLTTGFTEAFFVTPFEVIKVAQQTNYAKVKETPSAWSVYRSVVSKHGYGFSGLYRGLTAVMLRNSVFSTIYFGYYHSVKDNMPVYKEPVREFVRKAIIGFSGSLLGCIINTPFDVAKSRIQFIGQYRSKYKWAFPTIATIYREEGASALYKGIVPRIMRVGPGGMAQLLLFEYTYEFLLSIYK